MKSGMTAIPPLSIVLIALSGRMDRPSIVLDRVDNNNNMITVTMRVRQLMVIDVLADRG